MDNDLHLSTVKKMNLRLIPFIMILYLIAYIDRANISVAALQMNADLALTAEMYGIAAGIFFVSYILFEIPSNIILTRVGAKIWIARIMVTWGVIAMGMSLVQTPLQLYTMRFLLGVAEAGFTPGIIYYLSCWYPRSDRARAMSMFYIGAALASLIGLPISGAILQMNDVLNIAGWRWLFLLEGAPAILLGIVVYFYLDNKPEDAKWLGPQQRAWLAGVLTQEAKQTPTQQEHHWQAAFKNRKVWLLSLMWLLQAFGTIGIGLFLPLIIKGVVSEQSNFIITLLSAVPFLFACMFMYFNGHYSDTHHARAVPLGLPLILSGLLLLAAIYSTNMVIAYVLLVFTIALNWAIIPIFWAVTTETVSGVAAAASIALINAVANIVGLALPPVIGRIKDMTSSYDAALIMVAIALVLGGIIGLQVGRWKHIAKLPIHQDTPEH
ncbi:MFS transporter [Serratia liquefaciens]|uniref:MFS transporter n=1 Tax=Serratia liquefaciens TaxID=614 RepID=UPI00061B8064|nr:MFS transporter [Serratia liquefaciens]AKE08977.1 MFS transporter [Serratia liquefaciens]CAI1904284.1 Inner membrane transport protein RhmT [Serratia liquefaciens]